MNPMRAAHRGPVRAVVSRRQAGAMTEGDGRNAGSGTGRPVKRGRSAHLALASFWLLALAGPALAADLPVKAPVPYLANTQAFDWTGWYVGVHLGVVQGRSNWSSGLL